MKLCKDCIFFADPENGKGCVRESFKNWKPTVDYLFGMNDDVLPKPPNRLGYIEGGAYQNRHDDKKCGPEGKWFEEK